MMFGFRLVSARYLERLEQKLHQTVQDRIWTEEKLRLELAMARQAQEFAERERAKWEKRAERFIDQVGASSGILSAPAMAPADDRPPTDVRSIFSAMGHRELTKPSSETEPSPSVQLLGVSETAAAEAISALTR